MLDAPRPRLPLHCDTSYSRSASVTDASGVGRNLRLWGHKRERRPRRRPASRAAGVLQ